MLSFTADTIKETINYKELIEALRLRYKAGCQEPKRAHYDYDHHIHSLPSTMLMMSAWSEFYISVKLLNLVYQADHDTSADTPKGLCLLFDRKTGVLLATFNSAAITTCRTAAAAALATFYLATPESESLGMIGAGALAPAMIRAILAVRPIRQVSIWSPSGKSARDLADRLKIDQVAISAVEDLDQIHDAQIICAATPSTEPLIRWNLLGQGQHLNIVGSFKPEMREADDDVMIRSTVFLDDKVALEESGDLIQPMQKGLLSLSDIAGTLEDLSTKNQYARKSGHEITLYKSVGHALQDLAAMELVYKKAER